MARFRPNPQHPREQQWRAYLTAEERAREITDAIENSTTAQNQALKEQTVAVTQAMDQMADDVVEMVATATLAQIQSAQRDTAAIIGAVVDSGKHVADTVYSAARALNYRLNLLFDQQVASNLLLQNISELLRVPDFQKERQYYIEQGFKHYKNAIIDRSLMTDALDNLNKAEEREGSDYVVLHTIGMIYLYSGKHTNCALAEQYFMRASRYSSVEADPRGTRLAMFWGGSSKFGSQNELTDGSAIKRFTAQSLREAGHACYVQEKRAEALAHLEKARQLDPGNLLIEFCYSKYLAANQDGRAAAAVLEPVIRAERTFFLTASEDSDLLLVQEVRELLDRIRVNVCDLLATHLQRYEDAAAAFFRAGGDQYSKIQNLHAALETRNYITAMNALDGVPGIEMMLDKWNRVRDLLGWVEAGVGTKSIFYPLVSAQHTLVRESRVFAETEALYVQLCDLDQQLISKDTMLSLLQDNQESTESLSAQCNRAVQDIGQIRLEIAQARQDPIFTSRWSERVDPLAVRIDRSAAQLVGLEHALLDLNYLKHLGLSGTLSGISDAVEQNAGDIVKLRKEFDQELAQRDAERWRRVRKAVAILIVIGGMAGAVLFGSLQYYSPESTAAREDIVRRVTLIRQQEEQQRLQLIRSQQEAKDAEQRRQNEAQEAERRRAREAQEARETERRRLIEAQNAERGRQEQARRAQELERIRCGSISTFEGWKRFCCPQGYRAGSNPLQQTCEKVD